jgi:hypothetical protein
VSNRLNCVSGVDPVFPNPNSHGWFNPAAFTNTVVPLFGTCARNNLVGPTQVNFDFSTNQGLSHRRETDTPVPHGNV